MQSTGRACRSRELVVSDCPISKQTSNSDGWTMEMPKRRRTQPYANVPRNTFTCQRRNPGRSGLACSQLSRIGVLVCQGLAHRRTRKQVADCTKAFANTIVDVYLPVPTT